MTREERDSRRRYDDPWPPVRGDYVVGNPEARVAVATLASQIKATGSAIYGPCKTENLGVEKIIANIISNCNIRFLLLCGAESKGHLPGDAILALRENGIDSQGRIVGSRGAIPFIQNLSPEAVLRFRDQVQVVDCIGLEDEERIAELVEKYNQMSEPYPGEPYLAQRKKPVPKIVLAGEGDLDFGCEVTMDTRAWLVITEAGA